MTGDNETVLLVDGKSMYFIRKSGVDVDYTNMLEAVNEDFPTVSDCNYYAVIPSDDPSSLHGLLTWLRHNGFNVHTAKARSPQDNVDISTKLAADAVAYASSGVETIVLAATSVQFTPVVRMVQRYGTRVVLAATQEKVDPRLSEAADEFYDLSRFGRTNEVV